MERLAVRGALCNMAFLSISSQVLFQSLDQKPLTQRESLSFNLLIASFFMCYARCCLMNPGVVPPASQPEGEPWTQRNSTVSNRWCKKCQNIKPPRAHHCKSCQKCIPKMDHHCIWIGNCVSMRIAPHFYRFLFYSIASSAYLASLILERLGALWRKRALPSYLGPSAIQLSHLLLLTIVNSITLLVLSVIFLRSVWGLCNNTTAIESLEIERHEALVKRARGSSGILYGPNGVIVKIQKQIFPYDIGFWRNVSLGMGTRNVLAWLNPLSGSMELHCGLWFDVNDFEYPPKPWPPPDPDKMTRFSDRSALRDPETNSTPDFSNQADVQAFRERQAADVHRLKAVSNRGLFNRRLHVDASLMPQLSNGQTRATGGTSGVNASNKANEEWRNSEGERLADFGVDEETEMSIGW